MRKLLLFLVMIILCDAVVAQDFHPLKVIVKNQNGLPVAGATVTTNGVSLQFTTDASGSCESMVPSSVTTVTAKKATYLTKTASVTGSQVVIVLQIDPAWIAAEEARQAKLEEERLQAEREAAEAAERARLEAIAKEAAQARAEEVKVFNNGIETTTREITHYFENENNAFNALMSASAQSHDLAFDSLVEGGYDGAVAYASEVSDPMLDDSMPATQAAAYDMAYKNHGFFSSVKFSYSAQLSKGEVVYNYSGYREYGNLSPIKVEYELGYKFSHSASLGLGIGILYNMKSITISGDSFDSSIYGNDVITEKQLDIPVYLDLCLNFSKNRVRPFMNISAGMYVLSMVPMANISLGLEFRHGRGIAPYVYVGGGIIPWPSFTESPASSAYKVSFGPEFGFGFNF